MLPEIERRGAAIWGISVDTLAESQDLSRRLKLTYPLASDKELRLIRQYGVEMVGQPIAVPATFVLRAGDGRIVYSHIGESIIDRPARSAILTALDQAGSTATKNF
jgi:peroxiredoxin